MKVLYLSVYGDDTGYANAATDYILALDQADVDIVPRRISFNGKNEIHPRIKELEQKSELGCDILIQHFLPSSFYYDGRFKKCIGLFAWETDSFCQSWAKSCNKMDEIWVINQSQAKACFNSGVKVPIRIVPHTCDINKYLQKYQSEHPAIKFIKNRETFKFYTISEFNRRKNFATLIKAFHLEFAPEEPVDLIIKTSKEGYPHNVVFDETTKFCDEMKKGLKLYGNNLGPYKKEIIITERLNEEDLGALHQTCDNFISPSYGEAWNCCCFDSMAFGKMPIVTNCTGFQDYIIDKETGYLVDCRLEPVFGMNENGPELYSGRENWWSIDILELMKNMRMAYNNKDKAVNIERCIEQASRFSYDKIGQLMKDALMQ